MQLVSGRRPYLLAELACESFSPWGTSSGEIILGASPGDDHCREYADSKPQPGGTFVGSFAVFMARRLDCGEKFFGGTEAVVGFLGKRFVDHLFEDALSQWIPGIQFVGRLMILQACSAGWCLRSPSLS